VSFGTSLWPEPESYPIGIPIYIYEVTRGLSESLAAAQWSGTFVGYRRRERFATQADLDQTRPPTTIARRDTTLPEDQQEPDWAGYLLVADLKRLAEPVWLRQFRVAGDRRFSGAVVRHPQLAELS
jgi:hypothetical protein